MPDVPYPHTFRVTPTWLLDNGDSMVNVVHFVEPPGEDLDFDLDAANTLAETWEDAYNDTFWALVSDEVTLVNIKVQDLRSVPYNTYDFTRSAGGGAGGNLLPAQNALVVSLQTAQPGRSGRGRMYLGGLTEDSNTTIGTVEPVTATAGVNFADALIAGVIIEGTPIGLAVLSRVNEEAYAVNVATCDARWDTQRRRANRRLF